MKKSLLAKLVLVMIVATNLSGCIVVPWWDHGHHGGFGHDHHGGRHGGHGGGGRH
jgi:hypothetical protein